jgi:hypothetical protein
MIEISEMDEFKIEFNDYVYFGKHTSKPLKLC